MYSLLLLIFAGFCFGLLAAAGVFTVLTAVGLIPRFIGETHSAKEIWIYEDMVIMGTIVGGVFSLFSDLIGIGAWLQTYVSYAIANFFANGSLIIIGLFGGMFVGCLALAVAEMLDSIPIFTRRISFRHGLGLVVVSIALGKLCGALYFFWRDLSI